MLRAMEFTTKEEWEEFDKGENGKAKIHFPFWHPLGEHPDRFPVIIMFRTDSDLDNNLHCLGIGAYVYQIAGKEDTYARLCQSGEWDLDDLINRIGFDDPEE
jgi:hypothetical protein